jgi:c-di-GMP-binding flagellar brake protein YcgR
MIDDVHTIRALLARLIDARTALSVVFDDEGERGNSILLGFDPDVHALLADELHPRAAHLRVKPGMPLRWIGRLEGAPLRFRARVQAIDRDADIAAYRIEMPTELDYRERRAAYRTRALPQPALLAQLTRLPTHTGSTEAVHINVACVDARVADISSTGLRLAAALPHDLVAGERWQCVLHLPDGQLDTLVAIHHVQPARRHGEKVRVGARFVDLSASAQRRIGGYAASLQRRRLRARPTSSADAKT